MKKTIFSSLVLTFVLLGHASASVQEYLTRGEQFVTTFVEKPHIQRAESEWLTIQSLPAFPQYKLRIKQPQLCDNSVVQYSGYLDISEDKHFYFWFFESRSSPSTDPLVLWLNGGPGCSSFTGLLMELGPCMAKTDGSGTVHNAFSWNNKANLLFLDQPMNVGYSYGSKVGNSDVASDDVYAFLQLFFAQFPKYSGLDFHVFGESYGGHYVPAIGKTINLKNNQDLQLQSNGLTKINLQSIGIGNGLTDPLIQYKYYSKMACENDYAPVLDKSVCADMDKKYDTCANLITQCYRSKSTFACVPAQFYCNQMLMPYQQSGQNPYDVRKKCEGGDLCYPILDGIAKYLNKKEVMNELGAEVQKFESCNKGVYFQFLMSGDWMKPYVQDIPDLLESGVRVLIYAGDADFICNWMGNKAWTINLKWSGQYGFSNTKDQPWITYEGATAGEARSYDNFTFLRMYKAGHMAPYDQPEASLDMLNRWLKNEPFN